ncbi:MAG TPA: CBS domain-containing protein [Anaerolineales bacterium]|nr:CBS domain-containing protein [Anaerolineales bacterium]
MKLKEIMTKDVEVIHPDEPLRAVAQKMRARDIGFLPVCDGDRLIGVVTDRDIIVRATAEGMDPNGIIGRDLMTSPIIYCFDDQDVEEAARVMEQNQIRRVAVLSRADKRLVGVVSLGDIATNGTKDVSAEVLQSVSEPG